MQYAKQRIVAGTGAALFLFLALCTALAWRTERRLLPLVETAKVAAKKFDTLLTYEGDLVDIAEPPEGLAPGPYVRWHVAPETLFVFFPGEPVVLRFEENGETVERAGVIASYTTDGSVMEVLASPEGELPEERPGSITILREATGRTYLSVPLEALTANANGDTVIILVQTADGLFGPEYATEQAVVRVVASDEHDAALDTLRLIRDELVIVNPARLFENGTTVRVSNDP